MATHKERVTTALLDRYRLDRELGAGGMATVYLAEDLKHHRQVAVKVLRPELAATLGTERFLREVTIAAGLQHPHVLPLYDSGQADGLLYYVMPYVTGPSLRQKLEREGELPIADAVRILRDIADAMAYAHRQGVVHRDIKPENVMLSDRHALVTDFGVAKAVSDATGTTGLTTAGMALGTPTYMAPEQAAADPHVDHRADIYAFGVMAYELLSGRPPFAGLSAQAVLMAHVTHTAEPVTVHRASIPEPLAHLVMRCLEKKPADRWQSAHELVLQLEHMLTPTGSVTPLRLPAQGTAGRRRWVMAAIVVGAVGLAAMLWRSSLDSNANSGETEKTIAVLPFVNLSNDPSQEYFSDGMTEEIINHLARIRVLRVTSRTSAMKYKNSTENIRDIAQALGVSTIVEGSIRSSDQQVRIAVQLIDATTDRNLWSETFDKPKDVTAIFAIQTEIARNVAQHLQAIVSPEEEHVLRAMPTGNLEAYQLYLRARQIKQDRSAESIRQGLTYLNRALELDPAFLAARCELAASYYLSYQYISRDKDTLLKAESLANEVATRDPSFALAHSILAGVQWFRGDFAGTRAHIAMATRGDVTDPDVLQRSALLLAQFGDHEKALALAERAVKADPFSPIVGANYANVFTFNRQFERAAIALKEASARTPGSTMLLAAQTILSTYSGQCDGLKGDDAILCDLNRGDFDSAKRQMAVRPKPARDSAWEQVWLIYMTALVNRDADALFLALNRMSTMEGTYWVLDEIKVDPLMDPYRGDARYVALVKSLGLEGRP